jgi:hypothetical protein
VISYTDPGGTLFMGEHTFIVRALNRYAEEGDASEPVMVAIPYRAYLPLVIRSQ